MGMNLIFLYPISVVMILRPRAELVILFTLLTASAVSQPSALLEKEVEWVCTGLPFHMPSIAIPHFPSARFDIRAYGAVPDGTTLNTAAFADAVQACVEAGGGIVNVPPGTWLTGPIELQSNVCLNLERGAVVQLSNRLEDFPLIPRDGDSTHGYIVAPPVYAHDAKNIAITGKGIIDGAGEIWRYVLREKQTARQWEELVASGGVVTPDGKQWWPSKEALEGESYLRNLFQTNPHPRKSDFERAKQFMRPDLVVFVRCNGILFDGPTFRNSPRYHLHPIQSENIIIFDVTVLTPWFAMNGDGIDLSSCRNVVVSSSTLDVGDDGICLKPAHIASWQKTGPSCSEIVIAGCTVYHAHGGFVIGSESYGGVKNVSVRNCVFMDTDVGIRFKSARGRGGLVEDVFIDGIQMRAIANEAVLFDMYYSGGAPEVESAKDRSVRAREPVTPRTPQFQNFVVKNIVCNGAARAVLINGLPELPIKNIEFDSLSIASTLGVTCIDALGIRFKDCRISARRGPAILVNAGSDMLFAGGSYRSASGATVRVDGASSQGVRLRGINVHDGKPSAEYGPGVDTGAVVIE